MATFELIILLVVAVLVSAILDQVVPKVSLPLIQIGLGILIAVLAISPLDVSLNPDFFLLVFVAPLLFKDAKEADKFALWKNRGLVMSLAIGLVVAILLSVGFIVHALEPSIPLAAAFALGAALGPTDAVAVSSLKKSTELGRYEDALLSGEALMNDATGVVSFQFAVGAAVTGAFSVVEATASFLFSFFGGIVVGVLLGLLAHWITKAVRDMGLDSNTFHVLFDMALPFIIYIACEAVEVSGILGVVAAGILISIMTDQRIGPDGSRQNIVSQNVWGVLAFTLNGIVFVLLGMQLPLAAQESWDDVAIANHELIGMVLAITAILFIVRLAWILLNQHISYRVLMRRGRRDYRLPDLKSALIATVGGAKGAVTLSIIMSLPWLTDAGTAFPQRNLLIFLASGVILCTLLIANFALPILAPASPEPERDEQAFAQVKIYILRRVINRLIENRTRENIRQMTSVIKAYRDRIVRIQDQADIETDSMLRLRLELLHFQKNRIVELMDAGKIDEGAGFTLVKRYSDTMDYLKHRGRMAAAKRSIVKAARSGMKLYRNLKHDMAKYTGTASEQAESLMHAQTLMAKEALAYLHDVADESEMRYPPETTSALIAEYQRTLQTLQSQDSGATVRLREGDDRERFERLAYNIELDEIQNALEDGKITRRDAREMRDNVYYMMVDLNTEE